MPSRSDARRNAAADTATPARRASARVSELTAEKRKRADDSHQGRPPPVDADAGEASPSEGGEATKKPSARRPHPIVAVAREEEEPLLLLVFSFLVTARGLKSVAEVSPKWRELTNRRSLYRSLPSLTSDGAVNWLNFQNLGVKNKGTEGTCFKCCQRSTGKISALKKARVFPKVRCSGGEGIPYYLLRELVVLKGIKHDHITSLELVSLAKGELHVFFPFVDKTLHEVINPTGDPNGGRVLPERV
ncbi:hypothetical protein BBJ28_00021112, partial [Nothophytophthora sp. Chile5]